MIPSDAPAFADVLPGKAALTRKTSSSSIPAQDRTVFAAGLLDKLGTLAVRPSAEVTLQGIGGDSAFVLLSTVLELTRDDGGPAHIRGEFAAFIDPTVTDLSILGRDVLNHFDLIVSRSRNEVLLLALNHQYRVELA